jgi:hypothetical protein
VLELILKHATRVFAGKYGKNESALNVHAERMAALIAWMLVVRIGNLVKDGAKRRRLRRSSILDKIANANTVLSMRSRPLSPPSDS